MQSSQRVQTPIGIALKNWEEYRDKVPGHLTIAKNIAEKHSPKNFTDENIEEAKQSLQMMEKIEKGINHHRKQFVKLNRSSSNDLSKSLEKLDDSFKAKLTNVAEYQVILNKILGHKYICAFTACNPKNEKKASLVKEAFTHITKAIEIFKTSGYTFEANLETELHELNSVVEKAYNGYSVAKTNSFSDQAQILLKNAQEEKDPEIAYKDFEIIADQAKEKKEYCIQFQAYHAQGLIYGDLYRKQITSFVGQEEINISRKRINTIRGSFEKAMSILPFLANSQDPFISRTCKSMHIDFLMLAKQLFQLCSRIKKDWPQKKEVLTEAQRLIELGKTLLYKDESLVEEYGDIETALNKSISKLQTKIDEQKKIADKSADKSLETQKKEEKYEKRFQKILKSFQDQKQSSQASSKPQSHVSDFPQDEAELTSDIPEVEEISLICIDLNWKSKPLKANFLQAYEENIRLLEKAKKSENIFEQIRVSMNLAECHKIKVSRAEKNYSNKINYIVDNLEKEKNYLTDILEKLDKAKKIGNADQNDLNSIEEWAKPMLIHTKDSLEKALNHQKEAEKLFEEATQFFKEYLMSKGKWETNKNPHSQYSTNKRQAFKESINKIKKLDDETSSLLEPFLLKQMSLDPVSTKDYFDRKNAINEEGFKLHSHPGKRLEFINFGTKYPMRSISYGNLFARSYSGSYFDPIEMSEKEYKRREFGK